MARAAALAVLLGALCASGFAGASSPAPLTAWGSVSFLSGARDDKVVALVPALEHLFSAVAGTPSPSHASLKGLVGEASTPADRPGVVVVLASADPAAPAVRAQAEALSGGAASRLQLPNAQHQGTPHPVFAALRRPAKALRVSVLGDCGGAYVSSAQPATAEALRAALEAPAGAGADATLPQVVVLCVAPGAEAEVELLAAAQALAAAASPRHLLVHTLAPAPAAEEGGVEQQRRRLLAAGRDAAVLAAGAGLWARPDRAHQTSNYTVCDPTCHKHVMWLQGLIVLVVIGMALSVGCWCMHTVDVPSRFAQPDAPRPHGE